MMSIGSCTTLPGGVLGVDCGTPSIAHRVHEH